MLHPLFRLLPSVAGFNSIRLVSVELVGSLDRTIDAILWNFFLKELVVPEEFANQTAKIVATTENRF